MTNDLELHALSSAEDKPAFLEAFAQLPQECRAEDYRVGLQAPSATKWLLSLAFTAEREAWVARRGGRVVGRVHANASWTRDDIGYIGFYEVDLREHDHRRIAAALLDAATRWLEARGRREVYGPIDWCTWFSYRFLVPQDAGRAQGRLCWWEPVTPPEFIEHWASASFEVAEHYSSKPAEHGAGATVALTAEAMRPAYERALADGYTFRPFKQGEAVLEEAAELYDVNMKGFSGNFLFEPIPFEVYRATLTGIAGKIDLGMCFWVRTPEDTPAGYLYAFQDKDYMVGKSLVVLPEHRSKALMPAAGHLTLSGCAKRGIPTVISALMRQGNRSERLMKSSESHAESSWLHEYVLLGKKLGSPATPA
jgi:hypothetical protein